MIKHPWMILFLTVIWCGFSNDFSLSNIILGGFFSIICHLIINITTNRVKYHVKFFPLVSLVGLIIWELILSSIIVSCEIIGISNKRNPKIVKINCNSKHAVEKAMLVNLISLTPGTLTIDINEDENIIYVHTMFSDDERFVSFVHDKLEKKIAKVFKYE